MQRPRLKNIHYVKEIWEHDTHCAPPDITLLQFPEFVSLRARLVDFTERDVHEVVAVDKVTVERLAILQLDQLSGQRSIKASPVV